MRFIIFSSVGHSATALRNFAIPQLSIPQNDIWQRDQNAKTFGKKCLAINHSENRHSVTFKLFGDNRRICGIENLLFGQFPNGFLLYINFGMKYCRITILLNVKLPNGFLPKKVAECTTPIFFPLFVSDQKSIFRNTRGSTKKYKNVRD